MPDASAQRRVAELTTRAEKLLASLDGLKGELQQCLQELRTAMSDATEPPPPGTSSSPPSSSATASGLVLGAQAQDDGELDLGDQLPATANGDLSLGGPETSSTSPSTDKQYATAEEAAPPASLKVLDRLVEIARAAQETGVSIASRDLEFVMKIGQVLSDPARRADVSAAAADRWVLDSLKKGFKELAKYHFAVYDRFQSVVADVEAAFVQRAEEVTGVLFFPRPGESSNEAAGRLPEVRDSIQHQAVPSLKGAGTPLTVLQRGIRTPGGAVEKAVVLVSAGADNAAVQRLLEWGEMLGRCAEGGSVIDDVHKALGKIEKLPENAVIRDLLNAVWAANEANTLRPVVEQMVQTLWDEHGWKLVEARKGEKFGEKHSPSLFERRMTPKGKPGMVLRTLRPGFMDKSGAPIQRAVVLIGGNSSV